MRASRHRCRSNLTRRFRRNSNATLTKWTSLLILYEQAVIAATASARFVCFQLPPDSNWCAITRHTHIKLRIAEAARLLPWSRRSAPICSAAARCDGATANIAGLTEVQRQQLISGQGGGQIIAAWSSSRTVVPIGVLASENHSPNAPLVGDDFAVVRQRAGGDQSDAALELGHRMQRRRDLIRERVVVHRAFGGERHHVLFGRARNR